MTAGSLLIKSVLTPLAKSILVPFRLTSAASSTDETIQKKLYGSGTTIVLSNEEIEDIIKLVKSLKDVGLVIKGVSKTTEDEAKEKKGGFLSILLGTSQVLVY